MASTTNIPWCDSTINFWEGCTKVSTGCKNCYAEARDKRHMIEKVDHWGPGAPRLKSKSAVKDVLRWNTKPLICGCCHEAFTIADSHGHRHGSIIPAFRHARVFSLSLGDWLDPEVPIEWLAEMLDTIRQCENLDWLLCTKRPELFFKQLRKCLDLLWEKAKNNRTLIRSPFYDWLSGWQSRGEAPKNVWVITSTENQEMLDKRVPDLLRIPAVVHGLSCEPLLGPMDLRCLDIRYVGGVGKRTVDWVIAGGESGPNARPMQVEWLRSIQDQCRVAGVAYFCKQFGADPRQDLSYAIPESDISDPNLDSADIASWESYRHSAPLHLQDKKGGNMAEWPDAKMRVRQWPQTKNAA